MYVATGLHNVYNIITLYDIIILIALYATRVFP